MRKYRQFENKAVDAEEVESAYEESKEVEEELGIGDSIDFEGMTITLNSARIESGGEFDEPAED